jgi:cytoskeletal protein CcmA (bactofilin family)
MFRKMKQSKLLPTQEKFDTLIGATTEIYGRLVLLDSVRIDGKVIGNIETAKRRKSPLRLVVQVKCRVISPRIA